MAIEKKGVVMGVLQMAMAIVSLLVGLSTLGRESAPLISKVMDRNQVSADVQSKMNIEYIYRSEDGMYRYYSDATNYYWMRVSIHGVVEYAQNPQLVR